MQGTVKYFGLLLRTCNNKLPHHQSCQRLLRFCSTTTTTIKGRELPMEAYPSLSDVLLKKCNNLKRTSLINFRSENEVKLKPGDRVFTKEYVVAGRITSRVRESSASLYFYHIQSEDGYLQVMSERKTHHANNDSSFKLIANLRLGDIVLVKGFAAKTKTNELSILSSEVFMLAPCLVDLPIGRGDGVNALSDAAVRYRNRELDLLVRGEFGRRLFFLRSKIISFFRAYLDGLDFMEVEVSKNMKKKKKKI